MVYEEIFLIIGIISTFTAVSIPFIMRALKVGEKQTITTNNFYNLQKEVENVSKKTDSGFAEATRQRSDIIEQHRRDMRSIYDQLAQLSGDVRLHTNQISAFCVEASKIEDRLRKAELEIVRNERSRIFDKRRYEHEDINNYENNK